MASAAIVPQGVVTFEELRASEEWTKLTPQRRVWLVGYIATGDAVYATRLAYDCESEKDFKSMAWQVRNSSRIVAALDVWNGTDDTTRLLEQAKANLEAAKPGSIAAQRLLSQVARLSRITQSKTKARTTRTNSKRYMVGETCQVDGVPCTVTAVDENGRPTDVEPLEPKS